MEERSTDFSNTENPISAPDRNLSLTFPKNCSDHQEDRSESEPSFDQNKFFRAVEVVERDSMAMAESFTSLFSSLRLALSEVTSNSVDHMTCFSDVAGRVQESALDAATWGNRCINSCLRLNEEMKGVENLAMQLKILRKNVDALDSAVNRIVHLP